MFRIRHVNKSFKLQISEHETANDNIVESYWYSMYISSNAF